MIWINKKLKDMREEEGFTLIELMVVVLIIAILIAIAIPTFLGARTRAQDRAAQSDLRNAVTNAKAIYTDNSSYVDADLAAMQAAEPSQAFAIAASTAANQTTSVVDPPSVAAEYAAARMSASGTCWYIRDSVSTAVGDSAGTRWAMDTDATTACTGAAGEGFTEAQFAGRSPGTAVEV